MTVDPYDLEATARVIGEEIDSDEPSLVVSRAACPLHERRKIGSPQHVNEEACIECRQCLDLACPAIEAKDGRPVINEYLCGGCSLCTQTCPTDAIGAVVR